MLSRWARQWIGRVWQPLLALAVRLGITPNMLTVSGLIVILIGGLALALGYLALGAILYLLGNLFDSLDGELARSTHQETEIGPFLDSICDHIGDFAIYLGLVWFFLSRDSHLEVILVFTALFGSVFGSHVRSRAGMAGFDVKNVGAFTRLERTLVLAPGILLHQMPVALGILAFLCNVSALQRIIFVLKMDREKERMLLPPDL